MDEKKYCYRYAEGNDGEGRPVVMLWKNVILRETEKTFWHTDDMPNMTLAQLHNFHSTPGDRSVKRSLKNAARSYYHATKEEAMRAFIYRKAFQLNRMRLTAETIDLCLMGLYAAGHVINEHPDDSHQISRFAKVVSVPESEYFIASETPGPVAAEYGWGEW